MKMRIFLVWTERRGWLRDYGKPRAALWCFDGTAEDFGAALTYARKSGDDYRVYCSAADEYGAAKAEAVEEYLHRF